jgi:fructose-1,6-bisphosphatase/inositol monophosphatase family enzyme
VSAELSEDFYISISNASGGFFTRASCRPAVKEILEGAADAIQAAVRGFAGDPGEVVGRGATGANTQRIDLVAEQAAFRFLKDRGLSYTVVSEEAGRVEADGEWTLVLDPVDGTHNAVRGFPAYAVSIAAVPRAPRGGIERLRDVRAGLVRDLVTGQTYYAEAGKGASLEGRPIHVRNPFAPRDTVFDVYLGEKAHADALLVANAARRVRNLGAASLDLCMVAKGAVDLYYLHSTEVGHELRAMDVAAGVLMVREAGGEVVGLDRKPLDMELGPAARTNVIAYGDAQILEMLL